MLFWAYLKASQSEQYIFSVCPRDAKLLAVHQPRAPGREVAPVAQRSRRRHLFGAGHDPFQHPEDEGPGDQLQERPGAPTAQAAAHHLWAHVLSEVHQDF